MEEEIEKQEKNNLKNSKERIVEILKQRGPSLPVHIARSTGLDMLFASAYLSELVSDKTVKVSHLKIGGSPLYYLPGQKQELENFSDNLPGKEQEAFQLLRKNKILKDKEQEPSIRVALRNLNDFASPIQIQKNQEKELYWHFYTLNEKEAREAIENKDKEVKKKVEKKSKKGEKPLIQIREKERKRKRKKEKSDFAKKIISFLAEENVEIIEEKQEKKKEYTCIIKIRSDIGSLKFLCVAKKRKQIRENDIALLVQKSREQGMPVLLITDGSLSKNAKEYVKNYSGLIKVKKTGK